MAREELIQIFNQKLKIEKLKRHTVEAKVNVSIAERDAAIAERDAVGAKVNVSIAERDAAIAERYAAIAERDLLKVENEELRKYFKYKN